MKGRVLAMLYRPSNVSRKIIMSQLLLNSSNDEQMSRSNAGRSDLYHNPLHTFPRNFPVDGEVANLLQTCCGLVSDTANKTATSWQQIVVVEFEKRHDTKD